MPKKQTYGQRDMVGVAVRPPAGVPRITPGHARLGARCGAAKPRGYPHHAGRHGRCRKGGKPPARPSNFLWGGHIRQKKESGNSQWPFPLVEINAPGTLRTEHRDVS